MSRMKIETESKLLELKGLLNGISHASFSYSKIEKKYPMHLLTEEDALSLIDAYRDIIDNLIIYLTKNESDKHSPD